MRGGIPFSASWLCSSVVCVLISLISNTRLIEPHDIILISFGCGLIGQPAVRGCKCHHSIALPLPHGHAQPSLLGFNDIDMHAWVACTNLATFYLNLNFFLTRKCFSTVVAIRIDKQSIRFCDLI